MILISDIVLIRVNTSYVFPHNRAELLRSLPIHAEAEALLVVELNVPLSQVVSLFLLPSIQVFVTIALGLLLGDASSFSILWPPNAEFFLFHPLFEQVINVLRRLLLLARIVGGDARDFNRG